MYSTLRFSRHSNSGSVSFSKQFLWWWRGLFCLGYEFGRSISQLTNEIGLRVFLYSCQRFCWQSSLLTQFRLVLEYMSETAQQYSWIDLFFKCRIQFLEISRSRDFLNSWRSVRHWMKSCRASSHWSTICTCCRYTSCEDSSDHFNSQLGQNVFRAKCTCDPSDSSYWKSSAFAALITNLSIPTFVADFVFRCSRTPIALLFTSVVWHPTSFRAQPIRRTFQKQHHELRTRQRFLRQSSKSPPPATSWHSHPRTSNFTFYRLERTPIGVSLKTNGAPVCCRQSFRLWCCAHDVILTNRPVVLGFTRTNSDVHDLLYKINDADLLDLLLTPMASRHRLFVSANSVRLFLFLETHVCFFVSDSSWIRHDNIRAFRRMNHVGRRTLFWIRHTVRRVFDGINHADVNDFYSYRHAGPTNFCESSRPSPCISLLASRRIDVCELHFFRHADPPGFCCVRRVDRRNPYDSVFLLCILSSTFPTIRTPFLLTTWTTLDLLPHLRSSRGSTLVLTLPHGVFGDMSLRISSTSSHSSSSRPPSLYVVDVQRCRRRPSVLLESVWPFWQHAISAALKVSWLLSVSSKLSSICSFVCEQVFDSADILHKSGSFTPPLSSRSILLHPVRNRQRHLMHKCLSCRFRALALHCEHLSLRPSAAVCVTFILFLHSVQPCHALHASPRPLNLRILPDGCTVPWWASSTSLFFTLTNTASSRIFSKFLSSVSSQSIRDSMSEALFLFHELRSSSHVWKEKGLQVTDATESCRNYRAHCTSNKSDARSLQIDQVLQWNLTRHTWKN